MIFGVREETFIENTLRSAYMNEIKKLEKELERSRKKAEKWSDKTKELRPRTGIRGGRATSDYAKMDNAWKEVRYIEKKIEILKDNLK